MFGKRIAALSPRTKLLGRSNFSQRRSAVAHLDPALLKHPSILPALNLVFFVTIRFVPWAVVTPQVHQPRKVLLSSHLRDDPSQWPIRTAPSIGFASVRNAAIHCRQHRLLGHATSRRKVFWGKSCSQCKVRLHLANFLPLTSIPYHWTGSTHFQAWFIFQESGRIFGYPQWFQSGALLWLGYV